MRPMAAVLFPRKQVSCRSSPPSRIECPHLFRSQRKRSKSCTAFRCILFSHITLGPHTVTPMPSTSSSDSSSTGDDTPKCFQRKQFKINGEIFTLVQLPTPMSRSMRFMTWMAGCPSDFSRLVESGSKKELSWVSDRYPGVESAPRRSCRSK